MSCLFEMHYHTPQTSHCGRVPPHEALPVYKELGYRGVVVTDHYYEGWFEETKELAWEEQVEKWLTGYRAAREVAKGLGDFTVLLGVELRFTDNLNDHLIYGVSEELLKTCPRWYAMTPEEFRAFADRHGLFFAQAHPFRSVCSPRDPKILDGMEIYNGNARWQSHNDTAQAFAEKHSLLPLSGSDFHEQEDLGRGGTYLSRCPSDERDLVRILREGGVLGFRRDGQGQEPLSD